MTPVRFHFYSLLQSLLRLPTTPSLLPVASAFALLMSLILAVFEVKGREEHAVLKGHPVSMVTG